MADQKRSGMWLEKAGWRVTVEDKTTVNKLAGFFPSQIVSMQEGGAVSLTDVSKQFPDAERVGEMLMECVSIEQGQLLRAAEPMSGHGKEKQSRFLKHLHNDSETYVSTHT